MNSRLEKLRKKLVKAVEVYWVNSKETKKISKKFDELVSEFYKKEKQYPTESIIHIKYLETIEELKKVTRDFSEYPTIKEWNKYAKTKNLLCSESLKYVTGINWHELRNRIKSEV